MTALALMVSVPSASSATTPFTAPSSMTSSVAAVDLRMSTPSSSARAIMGVMKPSMALELWNQWNVASEQVPK